MRRIVTATAVAAQLFCTSAYADTHEFKADEALVETEKAEGQTRHYLIVKGLYSLGDDVREEKSRLEGYNGSGVGIDIGYRLKNDLALELDVTYESNTVAEVRGSEEAKDFDADFYTAAIDVVYTYEATESLGIFAKVGFEYEWADIDELGSENDSGMVFGTGFEYALNERYKLVGEYEHATIKSARGDAVFAGVMINF